MKFKTHQSSEKETGATRAAAGFSNKNPQHSFAVMPKLEVGQVGDQFEQEADRTADQVMQTPANSAVQMETLPEEKVQKATLPEEKIQKATLPEEKVQKKSTGETSSWIQQKDKRDEEEPVQMKSANPSQREIPETSWLENQINNSKGSGSPLPDESRSFMESRFGANFSDVKVHTGNQAGILNRSLNAQAFTHGSDVYFGEGKFNPESHQGKHLLAHELTHVVQQGNAPVSPKIQKEEAGARTPTSQEEEQTTSSYPVSASPQTQEQAASSGGSGNELSRFLAGIIREEIDNSSLRGYLNSLGNTLQELAVGSTGAQSEQEQTPEGQSEQPASILQDQIQTSPNRLTPLAFEQVFSTTARQIVDDPALWQLRQDIVRAVADSPPEVAVALVLTAATIAALADIDASYSSRFDLAAGFDMGYSFDFGTFQDLQFRSLGLNLGFAYENFRTRIGGSVSQNTETDEVVGTGTGQVRYGNDITNIEASVRIDSEDQLIVSGRFNTGVDFSDGDRLLFMTNLAHNFLTEETDFRAGISARFVFDSDFAFRLGANLQISSEESNPEFSGFIELGQEIWRLRIETNLENKPEDEDNIPDVEMLAEGAFSIDF
jgi:hypothetical protein